MSIRNTSRGIPAVLLLTAGFALAACGPSDDSSGPAAVSSPTPSSSTPPASSTAAPPSGPATSTTGSTPAATKPSTANGAAGSTVAGCATSHLKITTADQNSGAGSTMFELVFQNTGSAPCTLHGYPGVSFVTSGNAQLGKAAARTGGATPVVTLIPNAHAYVDVRTVNGVGGYDPAACKLTKVPALRIYPPNQKQSVNIAWNQEECVGPTIQNLQVGPAHSNR
ncbi:DUF4232 domain-containing protein [Streptomyces sp. IBSBF 2435]|uniref:DUF4232 domain-containing protein n=1 Tax=Streptomyces sp. IBSBF 2435 TaxID=2903531 RepID=UPI002FDBD5DE